MDKTASLTLVANQSSASSVPVQRTMDLVSVESFERLEKECQRPAVDFIDLDDSIYDDVSESRVDFSNTFERVNYILHKGVKIKQEPSFRIEEGSIPLEQRTPVPDIVRNQWSKAREIPHPRFSDNMELPRPRASETQIEDVSCPSLLLQNSTFGPPLTSSSMIDKSAQKADRAKIFVSQNLFRTPSLPEERLPTLAEISTSAPAMDAVQVKKGPGLVDLNDITIPSRFLGETTVFGNRSINSDVELVDLLFPSQNLDENLLSEMSQNQQSQGPAATEKNFSRRNLEEDVVMTSSENPRANGSRNEQCVPDVPSTSIQKLSPAVIETPAPIRSSSPAVPIRNSAPAAPIREQSVPVAKSAASLGANLPAARTSMPAVKRHVLSNLINDFQKRPEGYEKLSPVIEKDLFVGSIEETIKALEAADPQPPLANSAPVSPVVAEPVRRVRSDF